MWFASRAIACETLCALCSRRQSTSSEGGLRVSAEESSTAANAHCTTACACAASSRPAAAGGASRVAASSSATRQCSAKLRVASVAVALPSLPPPACVHHTALFSSAP